MFCFVINAFVGYVSKIFSVGFKGKSVFKRVEILESYNKKNRGANRCGIVENCAEDFPDKDSPAPEKFFKSLDFFFGTFILAVSKNFKSISRFIAVRKECVIFSA